MFKIIKESKKSKSRTGILEVFHGKIYSPFFMPIATRGAVKTLSSEDLQEVGAKIILSNTYHLLLNPGTDLLNKSKGLHNFMNWQSPILTDSGGYQIFSLAKHRKITNKGVDFKDPQNGKSYSLTPEKAVKIQKAIGSDIAMVLDECPAYPCSRENAKKSAELTAIWAKRARREFLKIKKNKQLQFGIVQGSVYKDLRVKSAKDICSINFEGYAIGGVAVGEPRDKLKDILKWIIPELPKNQPRYLMGLGRPEEILYAVKQGIDMFDCVIPTREARHGRLYLLNGNWNILRNNFYKTININNAKFANDLSPINNTSLKKYSKAYLHHLFKTNELLGLRLATINNLDFYLALMEEIRKKINTGKL